MGLKADSAEFDRIADDLWSGKRGNIVDTGSTRHAIDSLLDVPDFRCTHMDSIRYVHRTTGDAEIYWVNNHKNSEQYKMAYIADQYNRHLNVTIREYQKLLYTVTGKAVPDNYSANFKMACRHFHRFITQENQFLLGNGVTWGQEDTDERLGTRRYPFKSLRVTMLLLKIGWVLV